MNISQVDSESPESSGSISTSTPSSLEREKWEVERSIREREVIVKEREQSCKESELALRRAEMSVSRWNNPLAIAIFAAAIAAAGNSIVARLNGMAQMDLEGQKAEQTRILEMIKADHPDRAAENLDFLLRAGLIRDELIRNDIASFLATREIGRGPSLPSSINDRYKKAVLNATIAAPEKISYDLIEVSDKNTQIIWNNDRSKILVVAWKSQDSYEKYIKPSSLTSSVEGFAMWVTVAPQVKNFCRDFLRGNQGKTIPNVAMRLKQYLGLASEWKYDVFVEMWVSPQDLFRPCIDPEIHDNHCDIGFVENRVVVKGIQDYASFYKDLFYNAHYSNPGIPWIGLGYSYDWGDSKTHVGASEFIISPGSEYQIKQAVPTLEYCSG